VSGNNKVWKKISFSAITTTKIRVLTNGSVDGWSRITEVEAWTASGGGGSSAQIHWLVTDQLGTPRMVFDQTGSLASVSRHDYLPFGEELFAGTGGRTTAQGYSASDNVRQKFTRKERDNETGLDYFLARYYSSTQGRFTSPDEFTGGPDELFEFEESASDNPTFYAELADPQSLNKYQYAYNNPLRFVDPDGHQIRQTISNILYTGGDFVDGGIRGVVASVTLGHAGGPRRDDSVANRLGQGTTTAILQVVGGVTAGGGAALIVASDGAAAAVPEIDVATVAGAYVFVGASKNAQALMTTPMQRNSTGDSSERPQPKEGSSGGPGAGKRFPESTKNAERAASNNSCRFCGVQTTRSRGPSSTRSNIDHAVPKSRGGNNTRANAQNTCQTCNLKKGTKTTKEFQQQ
jgi:RHS repeat-associated protein